MSFDERSFRDALGQFATGVCVVCAPSQQGEPVGMTINSFASVSLDPPLVLWSLQNDSHSYDVFARAKHYSLNVLASHQQALSNHYAQQGNHRLQAQHLASDEADRWVMSETLASFHCQQHATMEAGDHLIIIGRVVAFETRSDLSPLLFHGGNYCQLPQ